MFDSSQDILDQMVGKTFTKVTKSKNDDEIKFHLADGSHFSMQHFQDCCEVVYIEDINGDLQDLVGTPILTAEERNQEEEEKILKLLGKELPSTTGESETWTFYTFRTIKGSVDIRWYGSSNGYYSEAVDVVFVKPGESPSRW